MLIIIVYIIVLVYALLDLPLYSKAVYKGILVSQLIYII